MSVWCLIRRDLKYLCPQYPIEGERETDRQRQTEKQRGREKQTNRQRQRGTQTDRQAEKQSVRQTDRQRQRGMEREKEEFGVREREHKGWKEGMLFYAQSTRTVISERRREENKTRTDKLHNH